MLRDHLVCGVFNLKWPQRLLSEDALTYDGTLNLLLAMKASEREATDLSGIKNVHAVHSKHLSPRAHHISTTTEKQASCGGNHNQANCSFINEECFYCHKRGHIMSACPQKRRNSRQSHLKRKNINSLRGNRLKDAES